MTYTLLISEKPQAALRIASALAEDGVKKVGKGGAYWLEFVRKNKKHIIVPAVGHLFVLDTKKGDGWDYPIFDVEWVPTFTKKGSEFMKKYFANIKFLSKNADSFIVSTDFDIEGEVIGYNIIRFICDQKDAKRMRFSTLTKPDIIEAYENMMEHIEIGQAEAGLTRHYLDFFWGVNTSRALTQAMKKFMRNAFIVVSSGRVQSPTLKILTDRELEIKNFVPIPYWQLELHCFVDGKVIVALYIKDKIWKKDEAQEIFKDCEGKDAIVKNLESKKYKVLQPLPFDTTTLQTEAYRCFGFSPNQTLNIAEALYNQALISYPRTASQKLPVKIDYRKILQGLSQINAFNNISQELLSRSILKPREGKKVDPAHIAIYPTGEVPKRLTSQQMKLYALIVKRFFSLFGDPAIREMSRVTLSINGHDFIVVGVKTLDPGWIKYYDDFIKLEERILPKLEKGQVLRVKELKMIQKETQPPNRYTQASIIKEMEKRGLGTKATRHEILQTLYDRGYIKGKSIEVTDFGEKVVKVLSKYCPKIVSEELTRKFEEEMEMVLQREKKMDAVINEAKDVLNEILVDFKNNEEKVGQALSEAYISFKKNEKIIGKCPECGGDIKIIVSRKSGKRFCGCSNYSKGCKFSTPLPQTGVVKGLNKQCDVCGYPMIAVKFKRRWYNSCTNMRCPTKEVQKS
ncbi:MAG: DNA topoisomerase I [Candidatus Aenigmarchaeota archaeon]|nr:DNA topoisomerase I [Candidatus Aenigmarchaeota archaeon]